MLRWPLLQGHAEWQALAAVAWLGVGLGGVAAWDWHANRQAAQQAQEVLPFVHGQIVKVWWLLLAAGVLYTGSTFFFGGALQTYLVWLALVGLGLFLHGLFSQELVEWVGASCFLLALLASTSGLPLDWHRAVVINVSAVGLPLLGWMLHRWPEPSSRLVPLMTRVAVWMLASVVPALVLQLWQPGWRLPEDVPVYTQAELQRRGPPSSWPHHLALRVPKGTQLALRIELQGDVLGAAADSPTVLNYTVLHDMEFLMTDGQFTRQMRLPGEAWRQREGWLRIDRLEFAADASEPVGMAVRARAHIRLGTSR